MLPFLRKIQCGTPQVIASVSNTSAHSQRGLGPSAVVGVSVCLIRCRIQPHLVADVAVCNIIKVPYRAQQAVELRLADGEILNWQSNNFTAGISWSLPRFAPT